VKNLASVPLQVCVFLNLVLMRTRKRRTSRKIIKC